MKKHFDNPWLWVGLGALAIAFMWLNSLIQERNENFKNPLPQSSDPSGIRVFLNAKEKTLPNSVQYLRKPFWEKESLSLDHTQSLMMTSPRREPSKKEIERLKQFVEDGGHLLLSFHDSLSKSIAVTVLKSLKIKSASPEISTSENLSFENYRLDSVTGSWPNLGNQRLTLAFYSPSIFTNKTGFEQYIFASPLKKGEIIVLAGLPSFSNAILSAADNKLFAHYLAQWLGKTLVDEYHLYFTEKTIWDFLTDPYMVLPTFSILIGILCFFIWGSPLSSLALPIRRKLNLRSIDELNRGIISRALALPRGADEALQLHQGFILRLFPEAKKEINQNLSKPTKYAQAKAFLLLQIHRQLLIKRGVKNVSSTKSGSAV